MTSTPSIAEYWDAEAGRFDEETDHGLRDASVRAAWAERLRAWLPDSPSNVLDLGCGTGSLSLLLAEQGHRPVGVDLSRRMVEQARTKLTGTGVCAEVMVGDAGDPPVGERRFDVVLARHLLWTLPDPQAALRRWIGLLRPGGRLVLVEGRWNTPSDGLSYAQGAESMPWMGGVSAATLVDSLEGLVADQRVEPLTDPTLWGREIDDERYALIAMT
ncbi:class I SAM-dependent methyltransferase [Sphaerimonospora thailandensis]|uniref:SAM-dependent methyltransferase n=1 Tax=Sphaerimonospora thailandensis TaxID=795644 RepID=A0A8J3RCL4_9ACTN|nr:class I SAM-dependent methyltransferase [Sphaerimonospora thailandensis]GIH71856.1 SAM-dependent methyltransferase [Sphaerimonospora thailandensis]